ncbi:hypothetical protein GL272_08000 [Aeromonas veronii]|uniref:hypothetical protein n=1 Tax=Aeromonas veronii TaxID=654 RepID=UPI001C5B11D4|nr:hypothetical protein [Aeromonas veronii]MBW3776886.1 hypothetical protein [Aeromonas veronii]
MAGKRLFLEQSRLIETIALMFNLNKDDVRQHDCRSIESVDEKVSKDCYHLVRTISFLICHNDKEKYSECKCKECLTLSKVLSKHCQRCLSLYGYIAKQDIETSIDPERVKGAFLDFFILPYLMRVVNELKVKFNDSRILWYLDKYIKFIVFDAPSSEPILKSFLREHVTSVPYNLYVDITRYRAKTKGHTAEYQPWGGFINTAEAQIELSKEKGVLSASTIKNVKVRVEASKWHYVGVFLYQLLNLIYPSGKDNKLWRNSNILSELSKEYNFLYNSFLSLNNDMQFSLLRRDEVIFNLVVNEIIACRLSLDKKTFNHLTLSKKAQYGLSFDKDTPFKLLLAHEKWFNSFTHKSMTLNNYLKKHSTLSIWFDDAVQNKYKDAEFHITLIGDADVTLSVDDNAHLNVLFHKNAKFNLIPNKDIEFHSTFENIREYRYKEICNVITAFKHAISSRENKGISRTDSEDINYFCEGVLNGVPTMEDIQKEESKLKALLKEGRGSLYTSFFAWCIFIAKCKHNKINAGNEIKYCESKLIEYQDDYDNGIANFKSILKNRAIYADFKDEMLRRLGYIRIYNKLVMGGYEHCRHHYIDKVSVKKKQPIGVWLRKYPQVLQFLNKERYTGDIINPFTAIEVEIEKWLKWKDYVSSEVVIDVPAIKRSRKKFEKSLSWLVMFNEKSKPKDDKIKMKLCMTCAVILYPELMTLAGLTPIDKFKCMIEKSNKFIPLNPIINNLAVHLGPCQCQKINCLKSAENNIENDESKNPLYKYFSGPIRIE